MGHDHDLYLIEVWHFVPSRADWTVATWINQRSLQIGCLARTRVSKGYARVRTGTEHWAAFRETQPPNFAKKNRPQEPDRATKLSPATGHRFGENARVPSAQWFPQVPVGSVGTGSETGTWYLVKPVVLLQFCPSSYLFHIGFKTSNRLLTKQTEIYPIRQSKFSRERPMDLILCLQ